MEDVSGGQFTVMSEHQPGSEEERNVRLDYYIANLAMAASEELVQVLLGLRHTADRLQPLELGQTARKQISEDQFASAVKEIVCIWLHQEAVEQGGEGMAAWLRSFFRLAFGAADYMINKPTAWEVMHAYGRCQDMVSLCLEACCRVCAELGFGSHSSSLSPTVLPVVLQTGSLRQAILNKALTLDQGAIRAAMQAA